MKENKTKEKNKREVQICLECGKEIRENAVF